MGEKKWGEGGLQARPPRPHLAGPFEPPSDFRAGAGGGFFGATLAAGSAVAGRGTAPPPSPLAAAGFPSPAA